MSAELKVIVPMCADFIHTGHINLLNAAAKEGQVTVLLMTDEAMVTYKRKPYFAYADRETIVRAMKAVHDVVPCHGPQTYLAMTKELKPDVFVHGDDWKEGPQASARQEVIDFLALSGGRVVEPPYFQGVSSSMIHKAMGIKDDEAE